MAMTQPTSAAGDVLSVQGFSFADSNQVMRRARREYSVSLAAQGMEDVVIVETLSECEVAHHADALLVVEPAGVQRAYGDHAEGAFQRGRGCL